LTLFADVAKRRYVHGMTADGRRHVLAVGGGMLMPRDAVPLQVKYAMELSGQPRPKLCVLNTAVGDDPNAYLRFYERLAATPAQVRHLALFPMPSAADPEDLLMSQDVIFVGGGSVANMLAVWRVHGIDEILRKAWHAGIVLAGSFCPHYNSEEERRPLYRRLVADGRLPGGIACDDGAAAHFVDETLAELVSDRPEAGAYLVESDGAGGAVESPLPVRFLGA